MCSVELLLGFTIDNSLALLLHFPCAVEVTVVLPRMVAYTAIFVPRGHPIAAERLTSLMDLLAIHQKFKLTMQVTVGVALGHDAESIVIRGNFLDMVVSFHN
jgi:hypothetical protein